MEISTHVTKNVALSNSKPFKVNIVEREDTPGTVCFLLSRGGDNFGIVFLEGTFETFYDSLRQALDAYDSQ